MDNAVELSNRLKSYVELARRQAHQADVELTHRHGAVLFSGGKVLNVAQNKFGFSSFGRRFNLGANKEPCKASLHAELRAVLNLDKSVTSGASLLVVRINRKGQLRNSKPCSMCLGTLIFCGINKVYYSTNSGEIEVMQL